MVYVCACYGTLVGRGLVAKGHVGYACQQGCQMGVEGEHGAKGRMAVETALLVEVEEKGMDGTAYLYDLIHLKATLLGT